MILRLSIDPEITERIPRVLRYLKEKGFFVVKSEFSSSYFGNFLVYLSSWRRMIRIVNERGQFFGEIWSWKLRWESIEGYLERKGVPVDDLQANLTDEDRLLALLARLLER